MSMSALILLQSLGCQGEHVEPVLGAEDADYGRHLFFLGLTLDL